MGMNKGTCTYCNGHMMSCQRTQEGITFHERDRGHDTKAIRNELVEVLLNHKKFHHVSSLQ